MVYLNVAAVFPTPGGGGVSGDSPKWGLILLRFISFDGVCGEVVRLIGILLGKLLGKAILLTNVDCCGGKGWSCRGGSSGTFIADGPAEGVAVGLPVGVYVVGDLLRLADGLAEGVVVGLSVGVDVVGDVLWLADGLVEGVPVSLSGPAEGVAVWALYLGLQMGLRRR